VRLDISQEFAIAVPRADAWTLLRDVHQLAACIPGTDSVTVLEPDRRYEGTVADRVGPFKVRIALLATVEHHEEPRHLRLSISGRDRATQTRLDGTLEATLAGEPEGPTRVLLAATVNVVGPLTTLGSAVVRRRAAEIFEQFAGCARRMSETGGRAA
jgi:carbon monoxide dehydrogenase subunit G